MRHGVSIGNTIRITSFNSNQLAPHIVSASKKLNELNSPVKIAKLNGEQNQGVRKYVQFTAYPTLYFFTKGKPEEFDGGRKADDIVEWIRKRTEINSEEVRSTFQLERLITKNKFVAILFCTSKEDKEF